MAVLGSLMLGGIASAQTEFPQPNPTDQEQLVLELINQARMDPVGEASRLAEVADSGIQSAYSYFKVDLAKMKSEVASLPPAPPLVFNSSLMASARRHSINMYQRTFQNHTGTDGSTAGTRAQQAGFNYANLSENIYAYANSALYAHAAFQSDWGFDNPADSDGMQAGRGHRMNNHNPVFREIGISVVEGTNTGINPFTGRTETVGRMVVTQDFGRSSGSAYNVPFLTGVAYYDLDNDGNYDAGEGIGGLRIDVMGASHFATTGSAGGYMLPLPGNGTYTVTISGPGMDPVQEQVEVVNLENEKLDFVAEYNPAIAGPAQLGIGTVGNYQINGVAGATSYDWTYFFCNPTPAKANAEAGSAGVSLSPTSAGYSRIQSSVRRSGSYGYRLAHHSGNLKQQTIALNATYRPTAGSSVTFWKKAVYLGTGQKAALQASSDGGRTWRTLWSQTGRNSAGDSKFVPVRVDLSSYAGSQISLRMVLIYQPGRSYYNCRTSRGVGFYFDDLALSGVEELVAATGGTTPDGTFDLAASQAGTYCLSARAHVLGRTLPYGPVFNVVVSATPPATN